MALNALRALFSPQLDLHNKDILAFRTITTMLSFFETPSNSNPPVHKTKKEQDELRALDALSTLFVRQYEVVAVALEIKGTGVQIIASVEPGLPGVTPEPTFNPLHLVVSPNARTQPPKKGSPADKFLTNTDISLINPDDNIPEELSANQDGDLLETFLRTQWRKESFGTHAWMLKMLLRRLKGNQQSHDDMMSFLLYVIAVSSDKMHHRITTGPSPLYFECLVKLSKTSFDFKEHPDIQSIGPDGSNRDQLFLDIIPYLAEIATTKIPHLSQQTAQMMTEDKSFNIYNKDTYIEIHNLLCELLKRFRGSLGDLISLESKDVEEIRVALASVQITGDFLWMMVRSAAIERHLKTINHLLEFGEGGVIPNKEQEGVGEGDEVDIEFELLKPCNTSQGRSLLPWQSYRDWLRLQTICFDATNIVARYIAPLPPSVDITVKILFPLVPDTKMLPWENLLLDSRYFPEIPKYLHQPSGKDLCDYLIKFTADWPDAMEHNGGAENGDKGSGSKQKGNGCKAKNEGRKEGDGSKNTKGWMGFDIVIESIGRMQDSSEVITVHQVDSVVNQMKGLKHYLSPADDIHFDNTCQKILKLKAGLTSRHQLALTMEILEMIKILKKRSLLYHKLSPKSLRCGENFTGTRHCEACIASLNYLSGIATSGHNDPLLQKLLSEFLECGRAIGVSKQSCPACAFLLALLRTHDNKKFITTGEHSRITACTLPEWLPTEVIKTVVDEFVVRLKKELVELYECEVLQTRGRSGYTRNLSLDLW